MKRRRNSTKHPDVIDQAVGTGMDISSEIYTVPYSFFQKGVATALQLKDAVKKRLGINPDSFMVLRWANGEWKYFATLKHGSAEANKYIRMAQSDPERYRIVAKKNGTAAQRKRNSAEASAEMFEKFHGNEPDKEIVVEYEVHEHDNLAVLGALISIVVETPTGYQATFGFAGEDPNAQEDLEQALSLDTVWLCSSEDGKQLYFEGGNQEIPLGEIGMDNEKWMRDSMCIGSLVEITYRTRKKFDQFKLTDYYHELGEETGVLPELLYDPNSAHLYVTGGQYQIKRPLIGVSPGIEN